MGFVDYYTPENFETVNKEEYKLVLYIYFEEKFMDVII